MYVISHRKTGFFTQKPSPTWKSSFNAQVNTALICEKLVSRSAKALREHVVLQDHNFQNYPHFHSANPDLDELALPRLSQVKQAYDRRMAVFDDAKNFKPQNYPTESETPVKSSLIPKLK